jgi:hypothetical protein
MFIIAQCWALALWLKKKKQPTNLKASKGAFYRLQSTRIPWKMDGT